MEVIRKEESYSLNVGDGMSKGLFNVTDNKGNISYWFENSTKDLLLKISIKDFIEYSRELLELGDYRVNVLSVGVVNINSGKTKYDWSIYENKGLHAFLGPCYLLFGTKDSLKKGDKFELFGNNSNRRLGKTGEIIDSCSCDNKEALLKMLLENGYDYYPIRAFKKRINKAKLITSYSIKGILNK